MSKSSKQDRDESFRRTYRIAALRSGEIWGRRKLIHYAVNRIHTHIPGSTLDQRRAFVTARVDDDAWMTFRRDMTPNAVASDLIREWRAGRDD